MALLKKIKEKPNLELDKLKKQVFLRITTMNDVISDLRSQLDNESAYSKSKIEHIKKSLDLLEGDVWGIRKIVDAKKSFVRLQNPINDIKSRTLIVKKKTN
ncbi:MAG: hypothetical protein KAI55_02530 [Candidatus Aenigmarchaeota archaeon]|nr:hypothetical protein [Candidatus Aenigmarchaeota archaeon]